MKHLLTYFIISLIVSTYASINASAGLVNKTDFERDGDKIIEKIRIDFFAFKKRDYKLDPKMGTVMLLAPLFNNKQIDEKTLEMSLQHNFQLFEDIGLFTEKYICQTPTGRKICGLYLEKINLIYSSLNYKSVKSALSAGIKLAISEDPKILESWSSSHVISLFINPNTVSVQGLARRIVHEMFQIIDPKNAVEGVVDLLIQSSTKEMCKVAAFNANLHLRYISSALRAFKIEDQVIQEILGASSAQLDFLTKKSCSNNVKLTHSFMREFFKEFDIYEKPSVHRVPLVCFAPEYVSRTNAILESEFAVAIEWMTVNEPLCEFLTAPDLDHIEAIIEKTVHYSEGLFHGPRPGIGFP